MGTQTCGLRKMSGPLAVEGQVHGEIYRRPALREWVSCPQCTTFCRSQVLVQALVEGGCVLVGRSFVGVEAVEWKAHEGSIPFRVWKGGNGYHVPVALTVVAARVDPSLVFRPPRSDVTREFGFITEKRRNNSRRPLGN